MDKRHFSIDMRIWVAGDCDGGFCFMFNKDAADFQNCIEELFGEVNMEDVVVTSIVPKSERKDDFLNAWICGYFSEGGY